MNFFMAGRGRCGAGEKRTGLTTGTSGACASNAGVAWLTSWRPLNGDAEHRAIARARWQLEGGALVEAKGRYRVQRG
jgi:hypothetical protein